MALEEKTSRTIPKHTTFLYKIHCISTINFNNNGGEINTAMLDANQIANIFTDNCSVTMPAENYLFIYKRIQELERERDCYKQQLGILKEAADNLKDNTGIDITNFISKNS